MTEKYRLAIYLCESVLFISVCLHHNNGDIIAKILKRNASKTEILAC